uniref:BTB domain-containing protein n=1 Tax=Rhabditophanes sp. KR3021 TaxID=114890 RepID=A0AC35UH94_9BILA
MIDNTIEYLCPYNSKSMLLQCFSREDYDMEGSKDLFMGEFMNSVDSLEDAASDSYDIWSSNDDKLSNTVDTNDFSFNHSFNSDISSLEEYGNSLQAKPFILASTFVDDPFDVVLSLRGNKYNLHKKVLKEKSQRFLRYFDESPMQHEFIIPSPFNKHEFKEIVNYFYGNECHLTISNVFGIMRIAHYYDVNDLLLDCENWLYKNLAEESKFYQKYQEIQDMTCCL